MTQCNVLCAAHRHILLEWKEHLHSEVTDIFSSVYYIPFTESVSLADDDFVLAVGCVSQARQKAQATYNYVIFTIVFFNKYNL